MYGKYDHGFDDITLKNFIVCNFIVRNPQYMYMLYLKDYLSERNYTFGFPNLYLKFNNLDFLISIAPYSI